jgi:hypothetical protein
VLRTSPRTPFDFGWLQMDIFREGDTCDELVILVEVRLHLLRCWLLLQGRCGSGH